MMNGFSNEQINLYLISSFKDFLYVFISDLLILLIWRKLSSLSHTNINRHMWLFRNYEHLCWSPIFSGFLNKTLRIFSQNDVKNASQKDSYKKPPKNTKKAKFSGTMPELSSIPKSLHTKASKISPASTGKNLQEGVLNKVNPKKTKSD